MSDYILVAMFSAVPFGLVLGMLIAKYVIASDEQVEKYGTREMIFIIEG
jgi:hypothetical protein